MKTLYLDQSVIYKNDTIAPTGTVYTTEPVAKQLVFLGIKAYFKYNLPEYEKQFIHVYSHDYFLDKHCENCQMLYESIKKIKVVDLCSGSGNLLIAYIQFFIYLSLQNNAPLIAIKTWLKDSIFANDIDAIGVQAYKDQLRSLFACLNITLEDDLINISCVDVLRTPLPFAQQTFDLILGNPPYIGEKGNTGIFSAIKETSFGNAFYEAKMDYFYFFIYKSYEYLSSNGIMSYITTNYFLTADGADKLRNFIKHTFFMTQWLDMKSIEAFKKKKLHACIYTLSKNKPEKVDLYNIHLEHIDSLSYDEIFRSDNNICLITDDILRKKLAKMNDNSIGTLGDYYQISQGIVSGMDRKSGKGVFVLDKDEVQQLKLENIHPFYKNSAIKKYHYDEVPNYWVIYSNATKPSKILLDHLLPYKEDLLKRREVEKGVRQWYELTWPRNETLFTGEKIVVPQRAYSNKFAYVESDFYASADVYYIKSKSNSPYNLKLLTLLLNSTPYFEWLQNLGKRKGELLELYATPLKKIPLPMLSQEDLKSLKYYTDILWEKYETLCKNDIEQIDHIINTAFNTL